MKTYHKIKGDKLLCSSRKLASSYLITEDETKVSCERCLYLMMHEATIEKRHCVDCGKNKETKDFYVVFTQHTNRLYAHVMDHCKSCHVERKRQYQKTCPEKIREYQKKYHETYVRKKKV